MFDAFIQEDSSTSRRFGGTGLGLTICKQLITSMGGDIVIRSRPEVGTLVVVSLTLPNECSENSLSLSNPEKSANVDEVPSFSGSKPVLIVEDNEVNQRLLASMLEKRGIAYAVARNGEEAVNQYRDGDFSLILMDCQMPILDGYQASQEIRSIEGTSACPLRVPIIALTAHALPGDREKCLAAGMDDYLSKPFSSAQLEKILTERLLSQKAGSNLQKD